MHSNIRNEGKTIRWHQRIGFFFFVMANEEGKDFNWPKKVDNHSEIFNRGDMQFSTEGTKNSREGDIWFDWAQNRTGNQENNFTEKEQKEEEKSSVGGCNQRRSWMRWQFFWWNIRESWCWCWPTDCSMQGMDHKMMCLTSQMIVIVMSHWMTQMIVWLMVTKKFTQLEDCLCWRQFFSNKQMNERMSHMQTFNCTLFQKLSTWKSNHCCWLLLQRQLSWAPCLQI